ncbi:MAG: DUF4404 family protein [Pirellulaceae bacterium]
MDKKVLLTRIDSLRKDLQNIDDVDSTVIEALERITTDIQVLVEEKESPANTEHTERHSFLSEQIEQFETKHPTVTQILAQLTDFLAAVGI